LDKIDRTVLKETGFIAVWVTVLSVLMQAVFLLLGFWDYTVLLGNLLGGIAAVGNFFLMGLTVQKAVLQDEKQAATTMKGSQSLRMVLLFAVAALGALAPCFHVLGVLIPLFFPRIAIAIRPILHQDDRV